MPGPVGSGIPDPVQGVTGGEGLPQGSAIIDPVTGSIVFSPSNNAVEVRTGQSAQTLLIYNRFTSATIFERLELFFLNDVAFIQTRSAGLGQLTRELRIGTAGTADLDFITGGVVHWSIDGTSGSLTSSGAEAIGSIADPVALINVDVLQVNTSVNVDGLLTADSAHVIGALALDGTLNALAGGNFLGGVRLGDFGNLRSNLYSVTGAPAGALGVVGDFAFRIDTPSTANQRLYVKTAAAVWTGIA